MTSEDVDSPSSPLHPTSLRRLRMNVALLTLVPDAILLVAVTLGWYVRWRYNVLNNGWHTVSLCGLVLIALNFMIRRCTAGRLCTLMYRLWIGAMLAVLTLFDLDYLTVHHSNIAGFQEMCNVLLMGSVVSLLLLNAVRSCCRVTAAGERALVDYNEAAELLGFGLACGMSPVAHTDKTSIDSVVFLLVALFCVLTALKAGSYASALSLVFLLYSTERYLLPSMNASINPYAAICFISRVFVPSLLDLLLASGTVKFEKWAAVIMSGRLRQYLLILLMTVAQTAFYVEHAICIGAHKEWYVVVPMFVAASVIWMLLHITLVIICASLVRRFAKCDEYAVVGSTDLVSLKKVLAARGVRYFSLVAQRIVLGNAVMSVVIGLLCWTTRTPLTHSLLVAVVSMELMVAALCTELSVSLGGTCIGYAVVAPTAPVRSDGLVSILPPNYIQSTSTKSTQSLQSVIELLTQHLITQYGADWSMAGISWKEVQHKLTDFFVQRTHEGPRFDTYLLYYSGPTDEKGDWALNDGSTLTLDNLMQLWDEANENGSSRLVIVADCEHSHEWLRPVWRMSSPRRYVALQTCKMVKAKSTDTENEVIGQLTGYWTAYNRTGGLVAADMQPVDYRPLYACSRHWTDFAFGLPSSVDTCAYWLNVMPRCTHACIAPLLNIMSAPMPLATAVNCIATRCSRARIRLWPPAVLDTAHGFKLIRL